jgi:hypothetical protein
MALKDCFREAARAREPRKERPARLGGGVRGASSSASASSASSASSSASSSSSSSAAAASWARMRSSQDEADGASQHVDLTPKANQSGWTSSWRKGMVNGRAIGPDACPAITPQAAPEPVPIEITDTQTGEMLYSGELPAGSRTHADAEEAAALAAALQASLHDASPVKRPTLSEEARARAAETEAAEAAAAEASAAEAGKNAAGAQKAATGANQGAPVEGVSEAAEGGGDASAPRERLAEDGGAAPTAPAAVRVPYRASMLTRVLRNCFEDESHRTAIVAAVAPGAESVIHTLNTLDHVVLMAPHLLHASCELEVPMVGADGARHSYENVPVHEWSAEQVIDWLATVDGGRFSQVSLPRGTDGKALLRMNARKLSDLVETENVEGREDGEGWYVSAQAKVGRALFSALRDAQRAGGIRNKFA